MLEVAPEKKWFGISVTTRNKLLILIGGLITLSSFVAKEIVRERYTSSADKIRFALQLFAIQRAQVPEQSQQRVARYEFKAEMAPFKETLAHGGSVKNSDLDKETEKLYTLLEQDHTEHDSLVNLTNVLPCDARGVQDDYTTDTADEHDPFKCVQTVLDFRRRKSIKTLDQAAKHVNDAFAIIVPDMHAYEALDKNTTSGDKLRDVISHLESAVGPLLLEKERMPMDFVDVQEFAEKRLQKLEDKAGVIGIIVNLLFGLGWITGLAGSFLHVSEVGGSD